MNKIKCIGLPAASVVFGVLLLGYTFKAQNFPWVVLIAALVMLANGIFQLLNKENEAKGLRTLTVRTEEGESIIAIDALQCILRDELCKSTDVHDVKVGLTIKEEGAPIECKLRFKLDSQDDIPGRTDAHKRSVRDAFERLIPGGVALNIGCRVDDIVVGPAKAAAVSQGGSSFSGPVYPVGGEEDNPV